MSCFAPDERPNFQQVRRVLKEDLKLTYRGTHVDAGPGDQALLEKRAIIAHVFLELFLRDAFIICIDETGLRQDNHPQKCWQPQKEEAMIA